MFPKQVAQPCAERHFLAIPSAHDIGLAGKQTLRRRQPDEILRGLDLRFEMFVLSADVCHSLLWSVRLPIADEGGIGGLDSMEKKSNSLLARFRGMSRRRVANS